MAVPRRVPLLLWSLSGSGCGGQLRHSAPLGPRAQPGLAGCPGPGPPEGGRAGGTAPCWGGLGFQQHQWCPRHRFPRHAGAGLWLSGTHRCPEALRRGRSVWDSEARVHEDGARPAAAAPWGPSPGCEEPRHGVGSRSATAVSKMGEPRSRQHRAGARPHPTKEQRRSLAQKCVPPTGAILSDPEAGALRCSAHLPASYSPSC